MIEKLILAMGIGDIVAFIAGKCISSFQTKYGETFFPQFLQIIQERSKLYENNDRKLIGLLLVTSMFIKGLHGAFVLKYQKEMAEMVSLNIRNENELIRGANFKLMSSVIEKIPEKALLKSTLLPILVDFKKLSQSQAEEYTMMLRIFDQVLNLQNQKILEFLVPLLTENPISAQ